MSINMHILIEQMIMFFIMLGCGFVFSKVNLITKEVLQAISKIIVNLACPMMVVSIFASAAEMGNVGKVIVQLAPLQSLVYVILTILGWVMATLLRLRGDKRKIVVAQCMFSNIGYFGLPLAQELFDPLGQLVFSFWIIIENLFLWTEGVFFLSGSNGKKNLSIRFFIKKMINPISVAVIIGILFMIIGIPSDHLMLRSFGCIGDCAKPLALVYIGGTIAHMDMKSIEKAWPVVFVIGVKMMIVPLAAFKLLSLFNVQTAIKEVIVFALTLPAFASMPAVAESMGSTETEYASQGVFMITLASLVTIPLVMSLCR